MGNRSSVQSSSASAGEQDGGGGSGWYLSPELQGEADNIAPLRFARVCAGLFFWSWNLIDFSLETTTGGVVSSSLILFEY